MNVNLNRISNRTRMCFAGGGVMLIALTLSIIVMSHAFADRSGGGGDDGAAGGDVAIAEIKALLDPAIPNSWGDKLNNAGGVAGAPAMAAMYGPLATLLPTVKPKVWRTDAPAGQRIVDYFANHFLGANPKLCGVFEQDPIIMGRYASSQGLYTFELGPALERYKVLGRYTFVYRKENDQLGFTHANTRIIQHHSSLEPKRKCGGDDAGGDKGDVDGNGWVNADDLLRVINTWGACPNPAPLCP